MQHSLESERRKRRFPGGAGSRARGSPPGPSRETEELIGRKIGNCKRSNRTNDVEMTKVCEGNGKSSLIVIVCL